MLSPSSISTMEILFDFLSSPTNNNNNKKFITTNKLKVVLRVTCEVNSPAVRKETLCLGFSVPRTDEVGSFCEPVGS